MSKSKKIKDINSASTDEDPLAGMFQLDIDENFPLEEKALIMMVKMLDNLEEFKDLSKNLSNLMEEDELMETRLLNLFKVLISGIQFEYKQLGYMSY